MWDQAIQFCLELAETGTIRQSSKDPAASTISSPVTSKELQGLEGNGIVKEEGQSALRCQHTHDLMGHTIQGQAFAKNVRISAEMAHPEAMLQDEHLGPVAFRFLGLEIPPQK